MAINKIGEVIASNTTSFIAQTLGPEQRDSLSWIQPPPFGSFVKVLSEESPFQTLGIVYFTETGSIDNAHRPTALNLTRQQLKEQQPQIFDLLTTSFSAVTIGYIEKRTYLQHLPPHPPQLHDFVYPCADEEVTRMTEQLFFLRTLLTTPGINDELVAATIRLGYQARQREQAFLLKAGRELSNLLKDNYDRLTAILQRIQPVMIR